MTQFILAKKANISKSYICRIENGKTDYSLCVLEKIASALEISVIELLK